jgi:streptomycin 6-kinase
VAIDPWGLQAETEFELGASLRNPIDAPALLAEQETVLRRLEIDERRLGLDADRALAWAFSQAVLAALWPTEEGVGVDMRVPFVAAATAMMPLLKAG